VYVPEEVNFRIVFAPLTVTVGDPVYVLEHLAVGMDRMTTPEPPAPPALEVFNE
jgi:hypothetical protein